MSQQILNFEEAEGFIRRNWAKINHSECICNVIFPRDRKNICAVTCGVINNNSCNFDTIYLVWKNKKNSINYRGLIVFPLVKNINNDIQITNDIKIKDIKVENNQIVVNYEGTIHISFLKKSFFSKKQRNIQVMKVKDEDGSDKVFLFFKNKNDNNNRYEFIKSPSIKEIKYCIDINLFVIINNKITINYENFVCSSLLLNLY